jgi:integrase/recombinase XerD
MKNFESFLAPQLNDYIAHRQNQGYAIRASRAHLLCFDRYLKDKGADWNTLQPFFFLDMRAALTMRASSVNKVLSAARLFFTFLMRRGDRAENPLRDIPFLNEETVVPFIFSPEQTDQLLQAVCKRVRREERFFFTDLARYLAVLLLARCGLRISEPLRIMRQHYRRNEATLYIEKTKFRKDRLIPIPRAVITEIENYLSLRERLRLNDQNPYLLVGTGNKPLSEYHVRSLFRWAVKDIGLEQPRRVIGTMIFNPPTPHSLRHSFAVNTLIKIKQRSQSLRHALPVLANYLGHSEYKHTTIYLRVADALSRKRLVEFSLWQRRTT